MRQAVVLIHGIGEQLPMGTVRPFVEAVLGTLGAKGKFYSKPDKQSELFELRKLQAVGGRSIHFYEYYWACNIEGSSVWDVALWLAKLTMKPGKDVAPSAKALWLVSRLLLIFAVATIAAGGGSALSDWYKAQLAFGAVWIAIMLAAIVVHSIIVSYIGDAARYLSPRPRNILLRQKIRSEGIKLLRNLHQSGNYDRIIVVGHSLGSVIGYDIISHLWQDYHDKMPGLAEPGIQEHVRERMTANSTPQPVIRNQISRAGEALNGTQARLDEFRETQHSAWQEMRSFGNPWLITDFITLGSPLAHALLLMASSREDFQCRKEQRELVTCPPQRDKKGYSFSAPVPCEVGEGKRYTPLILHHAAPFAVTRWTNLFFPARLGLFGDIVGGPLASEFGSGILDVPVRTTAWRGIANWTVQSHTCYWLCQDLAPAKGVVQKHEPKTAVEALKQALRL